MNKRVIVDISMIVLMPLLMAYSLIGETFHEVAGTAMLALFIAHHVINRASIKAVGKGKYTPKRVIREAVNALLLVFMIIQPLTGIMMSKHLYTFLHIAGAAKARQIHLCLAYWGFTLMSLHAGMHMGSLVVKIKADKVRARVVATMVAAIFLYGVYVFINRGFAGYMLMIQKFAFYDFGEPAVLFVLDYITVIILFMLIGWITQRGPRIVEKKQL